MVRGHHVDPPEGRVVHIEDSGTYLAQPELKSRVDIVEIVGGESGVGRCCIRRRFVRGWNFCLVTGFDLTKRSHHEDVIEYFNIRRPLVASLGPPMYRIRALEPPQPVCAP